jgi:hypothetical protein
MGNTQTIEKINFEDVQHILKNPQSYLMINTLSINEQKCLIPNTIDANEEELIINEYLKKGTTQIPIIVYGKNTNDEKLYEKCKQFLSLGFNNVYVYPGGLFEWLMLQDIYGFTEFPTTIPELDFLKYRPNKKWRTMIHSNALIHHH